VFADDFLPVYDVSDEVATVVHAGQQFVWEALMDVDLLDVGKRACHSRWRARRAAHASGDRQPSAARRATDRFDLPCHVGTKDTVLRLAQPRLQARDVRTASQ
jgi:hypothetical protein